MDRGFPDKWADKLFVVYTVAEQIYSRYALRKKVEPNRCLRGAVWEIGSFLQRGAGRYNVGPEVHAISLCSADKNGASEEPFWLLFFF